MFRVPDLSNVSGVFALLEGLGDGFGDRYRHAYHDIFTLLDSDHCVLF